MIFETVGQKTKSETLRPRSQKFENPGRKETQDNEISRLKKRLRDFKIGPKFSKTLNFPGTTCHPYMLHTCTVCVSYFLYWTKDSI